MKKYERRQHLQKVAKAYHRTAASMVAPYADWYNITGPEIDISRAEKELLTTKEAAAYYGIDEIAFRDILQKESTRICRVTDRELVRRSDMKALFPTIRGNEQVVVEDVISSAKEAHPTKLFKFCLYSGRKIQKESRFFEKCG